MNTEILGVVVQIALMVILAYPLGKYIAKVYKGVEKHDDEQLCKISQSALAAIML